MIKNMLQDIPDSLPEELISVLAEGRGVKIERIVSDGHTSPEGFWYEQEQHEWVLLLSGGAALLVEKQGAIERVELTAGDGLLIPAHQRHRVEMTAAGEKTVWLAVFFEKNG